MVKTEGKRSSPTPNDPTNNGNNHRKSNKSRSANGDPGQQRNRSRKAPRQQHRLQQQQQQQYHATHATTTRAPPKPTKADHQLTSFLRDLCVNRQLIESPEGLAKRRCVLRELENMLCHWSNSLHPSQSSSSLIDPDSKPSPPTLLSFGSYRLGVHTPDADVDCLVLAPPHVTRDNFFTSWVNILKAENRITELHPVASAYTPVIKFQMDGVKIDLIFARVGNSQWLKEHVVEKSARQTSANTITDGHNDNKKNANGDNTTNKPTPEEEELAEEIADMEVDDSVLIGLDETSVRSVNGVRVAQFLISTVGSSATRLENYRLTLRAVKEWAVSSVSFSFEP